MGRSLDGVARKRTEIPSWVVWRVTRALEGIADGEYGFAGDVLDDLLTDIRRHNEGGLVATRLTRIPRTPLKESSP